MTMDGYPDDSDIPESPTIPQPVPEEGPTFPIPDWDGVDDINL
jgi:hypothetical protein